MNKMATPNLGLIVTERCNLNCKHCLQGGCTNRVMSDEVIEAALSQFSFIEHLSICGGEPTLSLDRMEKVFSFIVENKILVDTVSVTINGTIYSDYFLRLLGYIEDYINYKKKNRVKTNFTISYDMFHGDELIRLNLVQQYLENVQKYQQSKFFGGFNMLSSKVFREGNAENLHPSITVPLSPMPFLMTYVGRSHKFDRDNGLCYIGPTVTIGVDGMVTECDASNEHQVSLYNYGNILNDSVENIYLRGNARILKPRKWSMEVNKEIIKYGKLLR